MTWTSLRKPSANAERSGRSIMRAVSVAFSVGRPSRLMNPPGSLPAAYMRSSKSTVSGKKSRSLGLREAVAVTSTTVSPWRTRTAPPACLASSPVSSVYSLPNSSKLSTILAISVYFLYSLSPAPRVREAYIREPLPFAVRAARV